MRFASFFRNSQPLTEVWVYVMEVEIQTYSIEQEIDKLLADKPEMRGALQRVVKSVVRTARANTTRQIHAIVSRDPRKAYQAVKFTVYKQVLGGSVSILDPKKGSNTRCRVNKDRKLDSNPTQRGGNRMTRTDRTEQIDSYYGKDRAFILRFLSQGADRTSGAMVARGGHRPAARRGAIASRYDFEGIANGELEKAIGMIEQIADKELDKIRRK